MSSKGWLSNPKRRERRDSPGTLLDSDVVKLIEKIDSIKIYSKLAPEANNMMKLRDKALIGLAWTWFKRGHEDLRLKLRHLSYDDEALMVSFKVQKKTKRVKKCSCGAKNSLQSNFCRKCGIDISGVEPTMQTAIDSSVPVVKRKTRKWRFIPHIVEWLEALKLAGATPDSYLFPPFNPISGGLRLDRHLTIQRFDQILQRLDPTLTSSMFRYGHTEKLFRLNYTADEVKDVGDWESSAMPERYAKRKGLTPTGKRFGEDTRTL